MTLDPFQPEPSGQPDRRIRTVQAEQLAEQLARLLIGNSPGVTEIKEILRIGKAYSRYEFAFGKVLSLLRRRPKSLKFFNELYQEYQQYETPALQEVWVKAMGYIVEHAFLVLMTEKYIGYQVRLLSECKVLFPPPPCQASTGNKSIDVIAWSDLEKCGEFLEVKKNIDTQTGDRFKAKVEVMYQFALDLARSGNRTSIVGVATLSRSPTAEALITSILIECGYMQDYEDISVINPSFSIIKIDNLSHWRSRRVI